ncbi:hypothetical protein AVEN_23319-1 [Araneus ventricosus]|uniref:Uncharacterized protein n=1 Tax=Araneus ventricosus TaxID=182803 RepID=A0A4Y2FV64_ARAVE|nr:hypothetical protein AVEN_23319-1 [Araneus ventricosus]
MCRGEAQQLFDGLQTAVATRNSNSCLAAFSLSGGSRRGLEKTGDPIVGMHYLISCLDCPVELASVREENSDSSRWNSVYPLIVLISAPFPHCTIPREGL